jgi:hypothetical protein
VWQVGWWGALVLVLVYRRREGYRCVAERGRWAGGRPLRCALSRYVQSFADEVSVGSCEMYAAWYGDWMQFGRR